MHSSVGYTEFITVRWNETESSSQDTISALFVYMGKKRGNLVISQSLLLEIQPDCLKVAL